MSEPTPRHPPAAETPPHLSLIVIGHNMARELPRTLRSLSPAMQVGLTGVRYEVIVVDNGSTPPVAAADCRAWLPDLRILAMPDPTPSPVPAINLGLVMARASLIGVWIDGARLASPGILRGALEAARLHPRPVIGTVNFHLGPDIQRRAMRHGYNQAVEDGLLANVDWTADGYRLFEIASFAGSSAQGWFAPLGESNAIFLTRALWEEVGGYDPRFQMPGGGLANLDLWRRACLAPGCQVIVLLGEGTFHQIHGGVATNAERSRFEDFEQEYRQIRGGPYAAPVVAPLYLGRIPPVVLPKLAWSANQALALQPAAGQGPSRMGPAPESHQAVDLSGGRTAAPFLVRKPPSPAALPHSPAPVAIGGVGGSGTRLIARLLLELGWYLGGDLNESYDNLWFTLLFKRWEILGLADAEFAALTQTFVRRMGGEAGWDPGDLPDLADLAREDRPGHPADWLQARYVSLRDLPPRAGSEPWGWKEPNTHLVVNRLRRNIPNLRYIHVMRHGLDMAYSANQNQVKLWGTLAFGKAVPADPYHSLKYWRWAHERVIRHCAPLGADFLMLNYDWLCRHPDQGLDQLISFLGADEPAEAQVKDHLRNLIQVPTSLGRFRECGVTAFDPDDVAYVRALGFVI